ncbi:unnamed protein product [Meloidogyne enterolobii]|uniref:Uncharacterized protein n=1 Tax=Meloidogyne enterolobii TaxID=390850 RepID=A0ACB0ZYB6_MELEN
MLRRKNGVQTCASNRARPNVVIRLTLLFSILKNFRHNSVLSSKMMSQADSGRIIHLEKRRERAKEDIEKQRLKLEEEKKSFAAGISSKFTTNVDQIEEKFKASTVGLVTLDEVKERQNEIYSLNKELSKVTDDNEQKPRFDRVVQKRVLSFKNFDDEEEDEKPVVIVKKRLGMDPTVDTSFLPDRERDEQIQRT